MLTAAGSAFLLGLLTDDGICLGLGVGDSGHPAHPAQQYLHGDGLADAVWYRPLDPGFPRLLEDGRLLVQMTCDPGEALFDWREYGLIAAREPVTPGHTLSGTARGAVLLSRKVPAVPFHGKPEPGSARTRVLRVPLRLHTPEPD
jgi:hypothetical protein